METRAVGGESVGMSKPRPSESDPVSLMMVAVVVAALIVGLAVFVL